MSIPSGILALLGAAALAVSYSSSRFVSDVYDCTSVAGVAAVGLTCLGASVCLRGRPITSAPRAAIWSLVFFMALVAVWVSAICLWEAFFITNQVWLHWLPVPAHRSYYDNALPNMLRRAIPGTGAGVTAFLLLRALLRRPSHVEAADAGGTSEANPYRPPVE